MESEGITPSSFSTPRNAHECVVCSLFPLFKKTETTFGFSVKATYLHGSHFQIREETEKSGGKQSTKFWCSMSIYQHTKQFSEKRKSRGKQSIIYKSKLTYIEIM